MPICYIEESRFYKFSKKLNKIVESIKSSGLNCSVKTIEPEYKTENNVTLKFNKIDVECFISDSEWMFVAEILHSVTNNVKKVLNIDIPSKYYTSIGCCEHCKYDRPKKKTFLFLNKGNWYQLGRNCINTVTENLTIDDCQLAIDLIDLLNSENEYFTNISKNTSYKKFYKVDDILNYAVESVCKNGYIKKTNQYGIPVPNSTYESVMNMHSFSEKCNNFDKVNEMKKWITRNGDNSDFLKEIKNIVLDCWVVTDKIGILISLVPVYFNETKTSSSRFYSRIGEKVDVDIIDCKIAGTYTSDIGKVFIYRFTDKNNYVFITHTNRCFNNLTLINHITGIIKDHYVYKNEKQTILTRVVTKTPC